MVLEPLELKAEAKWISVTPSASYWRFHCGFAVAPLLCRRARRPRRAALHYQRRRLHARWQRLRVLIDGHCFCNKLSSAAVRWAADRSVLWWTFFSSSVSTRTYMQRGSWCLFHSRAARCKYFFFLWSVVSDILQMMNFWFISRLSHSDFLALKLASLKIRLFS